MDREALRALTTDLIQRLRSEPTVSQVMWELLDTFARRLDRIELGNFDAQDEIPTEPARRVSSQKLAPVKPLDVKVAEILAEGKLKKDGE